MFSNVQEPYYIHDLNKVLLDPPHFANGSKLKNTKNIQNSSLLHPSFFLVIFLQHFWQFSQQLYLMRNWLSNYQINKKKVEKISLISTITRVCRAKTFLEWPQSFMNDEVNERNTRRNILTRQICVYFMRSIYFAFLPQNRLKLLVYLFYLIS